MKKLQAGLVIEGNLTSSTLLRLSELAAELGPIKSSGLQVARRVSNFLKAGYAVTGYSDLSNAKTVLIRVPDGAVERVVAEIFDCNDFAWPDHSFILCETWLPTEKLEPLRARGANIASVVALPTGQKRTFVVEGDVLAVRQMRRLIDRTNARTVELRPGSKHILFAATILCTAIPVPFLLMAQQLLREGGVSGNQLSFTIEELTAEMLSGFLKGARMTWGGPLADSLRLCQGDYWDRLDNTYPDVADTLRNLVNWSRSYLGPKVGRGQGA